MTAAGASRRATGTRTRRSHADVVAAAALVFARKGYAEATVEDIADELGILKGSLYHHVRSKSELLYEVVREPVQEMVDSLEKIVATEAPADQRLDEFVRMHVATLIRNFPNLSVYLQERFGAEAPADSIRQLSRRYQTLVELLVSDGISQGVFRADVDSRLVASTLLGSLNWMHKWIRPDSVTEPAEAAETILAVTLDGLRLHTQQDCSRTS
ncbi:MAG TPA: TetR/AcrR family transcriptional regulator [Pseudonocardia sp.]|jgi:AcrR family transcriptional regulator